MKINCAHCGKEFPTIPSRAKYNRGKYCSRDCQYKQIHLDRTQLTTCDFCGKEFRHNNSIERKYCSKDCYLKSQENPDKIFYCSYCGKKLYYSDFNFERARKFCSKKCSNLYRSIAQSGKNSHFWKGGSTKESELLRASAKTKNWRKEVFERDDYTCQDCGAKNGNGETVYLVAHHIKRWSDYPELRWDVDNGMTLCRECHKKTDNYGGKQ